MWVSCGNRIVSRSTKKWELICKRQGYWLVQSQMKVFPQIGHKTNGHFAGKTQPISSHFILVWNVLQELFKQKMLADHKFFRTINILFLEWAEIIQRICGGDFIHYFNPYTAKGKGVTTQMKALKFLMVVFTLLLNRVHVFAIFMFNFDRKTQQGSVKL